MTEETVDEGETHSDPLSSGQRRSFDVDDEDEVQVLVGAILSWIKKDKDAIKLTTIVKSKYRILMFNY